MGNAHADLTPPHARGQPPPTGPGGPEAYAGVRVETMPGLGGRIVAGGGGGAGRQHRGSGSSSAAASGSARPQTVVQKTKLVKNACHVHKDSVRLTRTEPLDGARYQLQFRFDAEASCCISVYYLADEGKDPGTGRLVHRPRFAPEDDWVVGPHHFAAGSNQNYSTAAVGHEGADLASKVGAGTEQQGPCHIYIVIRPDDAAGSDDATTSSQKDKDVTSQITVLSVEPGRSSSSASASESAASASAWAPASPLTARVLKQKLETSHGVFVLQEIYGVAGVAAAAASAGSEAAGEEDAGGDHSAADCVVCLTNKRELAILPCRHMCVCRFCAAECIRSQDSKCPICRNPAQALLKLTWEEPLAATEAGGAVEGRRSQARSSLS